MSEAERQILEEIESDATNSRVFYKLAHKQLYFYIVVVVVVAVVAVVLLIA